MDINTASNAFGSLVEGEGSVTNASSLSAQERIFCEVFVANGGKAGEAARAAGYADASADVSACRLLCRKRVADYLTDLAARFAHTALPIAVRALIEIAQDDKLLPKDRIKAATSLLEHGGMAAPKGGVQVNVGVAVNGQQAQQLISSVWDAKQARLSDIPPAMPDSPMRQLEQSIDLLTSPAGDTPGGDQRKGSRPPHASLPVHQPTTEAKPRVSCECETCRAMEPGYVPDDEEPDEFAAFLKGDDDDVAGV